MSVGMGAESAALAIPRMGWSPSPHCNTNTKSRRSAMSEPKASPRGHGSTTKGNSTYRGNAPRQLADADSDGALETVQRAHWAERCCGSWLDQQYTFDVHIADNVKRAWLRPRSRNRNMTHFGKAAAVGIHFPALDTRDSFLFGCRDEFPRV
eukprot:m.178535 g.178535  ORF g.178535 m.178535 type:complete len:152 (-) comp24525_c0_seq8:1160-1615(-)